jgi:hypothetical protein
VNTTHFNALARTASRRGPLLALGGAGLAAALTSAFGAVAKPKAGKTARKKVKSKCKAQVGQCDLAFSISCTEAPDLDACRQTFLPCCAFLGTCNAGGLLKCIAESG